jgi:nicotinamide-nucleotide amidase
MRAEIIATGTELLTGGTPETNSLFLADALLEIGIETAFKTVIGDNERDMEDALRKAFERADIMIVTGGIGPTEDDITRKAVAKIFKKRLVLNDDALRAVKARVAAWGRHYPQTNDRQALIPAGARVLQNPLGSAPGFFFDEGEKFVAVLPGVPAEMRAMFSEGLREQLVERFGGKVHVRKRVLRSYGIGESRVNETLGELLKTENPLMGLTATETGVDIRIIGRGISAEQAQAVVERTEDAVRKKLADAIYGADGQEMEEIVGALLKQRRLTLAVAESCTGGLIGGRITNVAGSSEYFERGVVVYSNISKTELLGVPAELIERKGAVSREVAAAMAEGIRRTARSDIGLSVTGIAGPGGGSAEKPVGLVFIGLASAGGVKVDERRFPGTRDQVRKRASQAALDVVRKHLIG